MFKVSYIHISPLGSGYMGVLNILKGRKRKRRKTTIRKESKLDE